MRISAATARSSDRGALQAAAALHLRDRPGAGARDLGAPAVGHGKRLLVAARAGVPTTGGSSRPGRWCALYRSARLPGIMRLIGLAVVLALGLVLVPLAVEAQPSAKVHRIGFLGSGTASSMEPRVEALRAGLRELGYVEGRNIVIEYRWAEGKYDRLPVLAAELVSLKVDVLVTAGTPAISAAKQTTTTVPIVTAGSGDAVASASSPASRGRVGTLRG
jgi:hypothetical protein